MGTWEPLLRAGWGALLMLAAVVLVTGCHQGPPAVKVRLAGAQIPVELVESWLRDAKSPAFFTEQVTPVYLSQHGFENLARGECDLACTDRTITPRELALFAERPGLAAHGAREEASGQAADGGVRASRPPLAARRVAFYGYALYVHASNPLDSVFARHLRLIFQKRITDWQQLAGEQVPQCQGPINLYGPAKETRAGMVLSPIANIWFANPTWRVFDSDTEIVAQVAADPLGLGFAGIGHDDAGVRYLGLRMEERGPPAFPSLEEVETERYGLAKLIYVYYLEPPSPAVQAALDYLFSDAGRRVIEGTDLWAIPLERATVPLSP
ncbi:MAG: substrate-binding domain-containing protein [Planctomycetota bacterium]